jgi:DNA-binding MarR family transcriptional regulator
MTIDVEKLNSDYRLWISLTTTSRVVDYAIAKALRKIKLTPDIVGILHIVNMLDNNATPIDIARLALRSPQTMTVRINNIISKGLLVRNIDSDRRNCYRISMTQKGQKAFERSSNILKYSNIMSILSEDQRQVFSECLKNIRTHTANMDFNSLAMKHQS